jgi:hypothetical protein
VGRVGGGKRVRGEKERREGGGGNGRGSRSTWVALQLRIVTCWGGGRGDATMSKKRSEISYPYLNITNICLSFVSDIS